MSFLRRGPRALFHDGPIRAHLMPATINILCDHSLDLNGFELLERSNLIGYIRARLAGQRRKLRQVNGRDLRKPTIPAVDGQFLAQHFRNEPAIGVEVCGVQQYGLPYSFAHFSLNRERVAPPSRVSFQ
jgi:hypothetical protein